MPIISIIIPIYNDIDFIRACLDSVIRQTFEDWECILVDDGSYDGTAELCDTYAVQDARFKVFHQINKGVSSARNKGIREMSGSIVTFVDADDYIEPRYLEKMYFALGDADLVLSGQIREFNDGSTKLLTPTIADRFKITTESADKIVSLEDKLLLFAPHERLFRSAIINKNNLSFLEDCAFGEDLVFNYNYLNYCQSISVIPEALYHYRINEDGLSAAFRPNQFEQDYSQWRIIRDFHKNKRLWNENVEKYLAKRLWGIVYDGIFLYQKLDTPTHKYIKRILSIPEIETLKMHSEVYYCSWWIKECILRRWYYAFYLFFKIIKR